MSVRVVLSQGFSMAHTKGQHEFQIEAKNLRGVIKALVKPAPGD